jgi:hypothetical protein
MSFIGSTCTASPCNTLHLLLVIRTKPREVGGGGVHCRGGGGGGGGGSFSVFFRRRRELRIVHLAHVTQLGVAALLQLRHLRAVVARPEPGPAHSFPWYLTLSVYTSCTGVPVRTRGSHLSTSELNLSRF